MYKALYLVLMNKRLHLALRSLQGGGELMNTIITEI